MADSRTIDSVKELSLLAWLVKDLGWVLVCAPLAWPAAIVAVAAESWSLLSEWPRSSVGIRVHAVAEWLWLVGNVVWLTSELLFDPKALTFPWYSGPLAKTDEFMYNIGSSASLLLYGSGLIGLLGFYIAALIPSVRAQVEPAGAGMLLEGFSERQRAFEVLPLTLYTRMFIGPWIAKDVFWNLEYPFCTLLCGLAVLLMVLDYMRRECQLHFVSEMLWVCGNMTWAFTELFLKENRSLRLVAATFLLAGIISATTSGAFSFFHMTRGILAERQQELKPLMPGCPTDSATFKG